MFKMLAFLSRKPEMSRAEFKAYYETCHAPLVGRLAPPMQSYKRNFLQSDPANVLDDQLDFDVVTEMEFVDRAAFESWMAAFGASGTALLIAEDEAKFLDRTRIRLCVVDQAQG